MTLISGTRGPLFFFTNTANWSSPNTFQNKSCLKTKWYEKIFITIPEIINFWETEKSYIQHSTSNLRSGVFVPKKNNSVFHADAKNYDIAQLSKSLSTWFVEWSILIWLEFAGLANGLWLRWPYTRAMSNVVSWHLCLGAANCMAVWIILVIAEEKQRKQWNFGCGG